MPSWILRMRSAASFSSRRYEATASSPWLSSGGVIQKCDCWPRSSGPGLSRKARAAARMKTGVQVMIERVIGQRDEVPLAHEVADALDLRLAVADEAVGLLVLVGDGVEHALHDG